MRLIRVAQSRPPCASTIERLIDSPMPMPPGLVVKKASNSRSRWFGSMPTPGVVDGQRDALTVVRLRSHRQLSRPVLDPAMASVAFITRFKITCWSWTRSPRTRGSSDASSTASETS